MFCYVGADGDALMPALVLAFASSHSGFPQPFMFYYQDPLSHRRVELQLIQSVADRYQLDSVRASAGNATHEACHFGDLVEPQ